MIEQRSVPVVLALAGNDPTGGAGLQADIEAIASMGCHAAPVVTCVTVQDTRDVALVEPVAPGLLAAQARALLGDIPVACIKIGLLGGVEGIEAVAAVLADYPDVPVILDPVLAAGGGRELAGRGMLDAMRGLLMPRTTVLTPNGAEARRLAPDADNLDACAMALLDAGCELVLMTGADEPTGQVVNRLYGNHRRLETFRWERLPARFHGSGCTLASAIAGLLAQGHEPFSAIHQAQEYTHETLRAGYRIGRGQWVPNRMFWAGGRPNSD